MGEWPDYLADFSITFKEIFPVVLALKIWGCDLSNKCITLHINNAAAVYILNKQSSKDKDIICLVRRFVLACMKFNILTRCVHVPGHSNTLPDLISSKSKLKSRGFLASSLSTFDFSTLYTTLPHNLIKEKLTELIEQTFNREGSLYLACNDKNAFFTSEQPKRYKLWSCQKMCDTLHYLLDNIFIRFGSKLYRQIVGIPMGTNCAPLVADLFLFCYERDFMLSLSDNNQSDVVEAFNSTSRYLDDLLNIDNPYFEQMVGQIYPTELQLNKANSSDTEAPFLDLNLSITNGIVSSKIYDKRDDFNFEIVNFPFLD